MSFQRQTQKDIAELILSNPSFSTRMARKGLEDYGLTLANSVCQKLKKGLVSYRSEHYERIMDSLYNHFENYPLALNDLDEMVREVESVLYGKGSLKRIIKEQKSAIDKSFKKEANTLISRIGINY